MAKPATPEQYLISAGWTRHEPADAPDARRVWLDPKTGGRSERRQTGVVEMEGGRIKRPTFQTFHPAPPCFYTTRRAVDLQRERDGFPAIDWE